MVDARRSSDHARNPDPVPTSVAAVKGYDGAYYISQLTGFPFPKGAANIYRVDPDRQGHGVRGRPDQRDRPRVRRRGPFTRCRSPPMGCSPARPVRWSRSSPVAPRRPTTRRSPANLFAPYGIAIKGNSAYVTTGAVAPGAGQVIRIRL